MFVVASGAMTIALRGAHVTPNPRDTLAYKDGDRIQGTLVRKTDEMIVFKSDRFGELRVPAADAVVIKAEQPVAAASSSATAVAAAPPSILEPAANPATLGEGKQGVSAAERAEQEKVTLWDRFSPSVLTAKVRNYFGPWHGRLAFSAEVVSDVGKRNNSSYEAHLQRKWARDEVQFIGRVDYSETNGLATSDLVKGSALWRHDFNKAVFANYRPTSEWDRASQRRGGANDYVLLQQELGIGINVFTRPSRKLRAGVSQNLFDTWTTAPIHEHNSRVVVSAFEETDFTLPWRITIAQRGVWYPNTGESDGWENRIDLTKKLTETLSTSLRHEMRRNNPDGSARDYTRLKLLFGLDF